jgi:colicin import membrane protein
MKITNLVIVCGLALAPAACKKDRDDQGVPSAKSVEEAEKDTMNAQDEVREQREDVREEAGDVAEQKGELAEAKGDAAAARAEFIAKARSKMAQLETRLAALKADFQASSASLKKDARTEAQGILREIDEQRAKARAAFDAASAGAKDRWEELDKNTGEALDALEDRAETLAEKLGDAGVKLRAEARAAIHD